MATRPRHFVGIIFLIKLMAVRGRGPDDPFTRLPFAPLSHSFVQVCALCLSHMGQAASGTGCGRNATARRNTRWLCRAYSLSLNVVHHVQVGKARELAFKEQVHRPCRAMALLFQDQFGAVMGQIHLALPFLHRGLVLVL